MCAGPESTINIVKLSIFFALSGSAHVKAHLIMSVKLTPGSYVTVIVS